LALSLALLLSSCSEEDATPSETPETPTPPAVARSSAAKPSPTPKARATAKATRTPRAVAPAANQADQAAQADWLVLFYEDADDDQLEQAMLTDVNEIERVGSSEHVHLVAQVDRYEGGYDGDGDWSTAKRFYLTQDPDLETIHSQEIADLGEVNMADGKTLVDFVTWGIRTYPARRVALILSDHGMGWPGGFSDADSGGAGQDAIALADDFGDALWLMEIDNALTSIRQQTGLEKLDLIGFDACLMAQLEVFTAMAPHARTVVASEEVEPDLGWAYADFLMQLAFDPQMDGAGLAKAIVDSYIVKDVVVTDDTARKAFVAENLTVRKASADEVARIMSVDVTLSAVDTAALPDLLTALDDLSVALSEIDPNQAAEARAYARSFENALDEDYPSPYIDLGHFVSVLLDSDPGDAVTTAGQAVLSALKQAVIAEKHGKERSGASGIAIYFPVFEIYDTSDNYGYTTVAKRFAQESQWDEYMDFYFTNEPPQGDQWQGADPWQALDAWAEGNATGGGRVGAQPIRIDPLKLTADVASVKQPVTIQTTVRGKQLAYLYVFLGRVSEDEKILMTEEMDYIDFGETSEVDGVYFPQWDGATVDVEFDFSPMIYAINDGETSAPALLMPDEYGQDLATYTVEGTYQFADGSPERYANLVFQDGEMTKVLGFARADGGGAPYTITPQMGDQFTISRQGMYLDENSEDDFYEEPGETLTFGQENFTWEEIPASAGIYVVGIIAEDFDGNQYPQYEVVEIKED
jgi:hypothetical protein